MKNPLLWPIVLIGICQKDRQNLGSDLALLPKFLQPVFKMAEMRPAIIKLHEKGYSTREIKHLLDVSQSSVTRHIKRYEETGSHKDRKGRGRKKTATNRRNIQRSKEMIQRNPTTKANSSRKLAKKLGVSQRSARRILREISLETLIKAVDDFPKRLKACIDANGGHFE
uniref:Uncharacterized protein n=1 Tax=Acrobeloides nanus TaxID=290746 RepID=A0A914DG67_9BILA